ncbi:MAG TPA: hypothetical protein VK475_03255, partial [Pyrinomonadaceae bacterium]|nr:hypothetical protein [Pyrinomonadaceae bacterium]
MKRKSFRSRPITVALIAALLSSVAPVADASVSHRNIQQKPEAAQITPANISDVKVTAGPAGVLIEWRASFELDHLGFNVYRELAGSRTQVNPAIITGAGSIAAQGTPLYAGYTYQWFDAAGNLDARYYLEDLDVKGTRTLAGPFKPVWNDSLSKSEQAGMISAAAATQGSAANQEGGPTGTFEKTGLSPAAIQDQWVIAAQAGLKIGVKQDGWYRVTQPDMIAAGFVPSEVANLRLFVDGREVPVELSRDSGSLTPNDFLEFYGTGLDTLTTDTHVYYLVNGSQAGLRVPVFGEMHPDALPVASPLPSPPAPLASLPAVPTTSFSSGGWFGDVSAGVEGAKEPRKQTRDSLVQTPAESAAVISQSDPVVVTPKSNIPGGPAREVNPTTSGSVKPGPAVRVSPPTPRALSQTRRQPRKKNRRRRGRRSHAAKRKLNHAVPSVSSSAGFLYDVQLKERFVYFSSLLNGAAENYFGFSLLTPPSTRTLKVTNLQTDSQGTALLQIGLQGTTQQAHLVNVLVNEVLVGSMSFDSQQYAEQTFNLAVSQLHEGDNVIKFVIAGGSGDHSLYSYARLTYPRTFRASNDTLAFSLRSTQTVKVDGFSTPNIRMLDVSDPVAVQEMRPIVEDTGAGFSLSLPASGTKAKGSRNFLALPSGSFLRAASLVFNQPS